jgi:hypothetical protein
MQGPTWVSTVEVILLKEMQREQVGWRENALYVLSNSEHVN